MSFVASLIGAITALLGVFMTQFWAERYKRHLEGSALAAGLLGELRAYKETAVPLKGMFTAWIEVAQAGAVGAFRIRPVEAHGDVVFDANASKIGALGADIAEPLVFVYQSMKVMRAAHHLIAREYKDMQPGEISGRCRAILTLIERIEQKFDQLEPLLVQRAHARPTWRTLISL